MKFLGNAVGFIYLIIGSLYFGLHGQPAEMALAIVGGAICLCFVNLDKFQEISGAGFSAKLKQQVEAVIAKETESAPTGVTQDLAAESVDDDITALIKALGNPRYTWRYVAGLAQESGLTKKRTREVLASLVNDDIAGHVFGSEGELWGLTTKGRVVLSLINAKKHGSA